MSSVPKGMKPTRIGPPTDLGHGRKCYMVNGTTFEIPNHYDVSKSIGFGAYGLVCAGVDSRTGQKIAIKKCASVFRDVGDCKRVLREVKLLQFLQHENTLQINDLFVNEPRATFNDVYIVSDLLDTDLNTVIRSKQKISEEHLKYFVYQILRGLKYIHTASVIHRDIKPANLLLNLNCDLRICDFGLSRGVDLLSPDPPEMTDYVVTRWYRPPELLLMNKHYTTAVDIWSVGCIFAEIVNRKVLFPGRDYLHQISMICETMGKPAEGDLTSFENKEAVKYVQSFPATHPKPMAELIPSLVDEVACDFLSKMLVVDPSRRATADELMAHPYMACLHDPTDEPAAPHSFTWKYDRDDNIKKEKLKEMFEEEVEFFEKKQLAFGSAPPPPAV